MRPPLGNGKSCHVRGVASDEESLLNPIIHIGCSLKSSAYKVVSESGHNILGERRSRELIIHVCRKLKLDEKLTYKN